MKAPHGRLWRRRAVVGLSVVVLAVALWHFLHQPTAVVAAPTHLALLVPDGLADDDVHVQAWQHAAAEVGFPLDVVTASELLRSGGRQRDAALIVPDSVHRRMNDALVAHLERRVREGALLMLVHDAGVADMAGHYHPRRSRLSALAGVDYALYGRLGAGMLTEQGAWLEGDAAPLLRLPPGKLMRDDDTNPLISDQPASEPDEALAVVGYHYGRLHYPVFATEGRFDGQRLMRGEGNGLMAGLRTSGAGRVLFVNLPLGYMKLRTDGFFLHSFLRFFAQDVARLPQLSPMPEAEGALIMNWHIDSAAAVPAMETLETLGAFGQGPYSVHLTAGPDVDVPGDRLGMDLARNPGMRAWVRRFVKRGDEVGSHGGWIHNEFGRLIDKQAPPLSTAMIERNSAAVSQTSDRPVREYSAPTGNHPAWVTPWLRNQGVHAYYFTGDIGMAPTRSFQDGKTPLSDMWAFPVLSYGSHAAFEEARAAGVPEADVAAWLKNVADFCARFRTVRLVYFHPPGIALFPHAFQDWLAHTKRLVDDGALRWMTMTQYADFANQRLQARWQIVDDERGAGAGEAPGPAQRLTATHPTSLQRLTWLLPAARYGRPRVLAGEARIEGDELNWRVTAGVGPELALRLPLRPVSVSVSVAAATQRPVVLAPSGAAPQ